MVQLLAAGDLDQDGECAAKSEAHAAGSDPAHQLARQSPTEQGVDQEAGEREEKDEEREDAQLFIRSSSSTSMFRPARYTCTMMAMPTTTSAAATVMTRKANTWPSREFR